MEKNGWFYLEIQHKSKGLQISNISEVRQENKYLVPIHLLRMRVQDSPLFGNILLKQ